MALNYLFISFFAIAMVFACITAFIHGDTDVFQQMVNSTMEMAKLGFEISLGLTGVLTLWMGLLKIGEKGGVIHYFSRILQPFFNKIFPEIPKDHPVLGSISMNVAANMLGIDNAATPIGLKAMEQLQELNPKKDTASNAMIMFLVLNTSGLTLIPISIMVYRTQLGAMNPSDVFIPIMIVTYCSTIAGFIAVSIFQKIRIWDKTILTYIGGLTIIIALLVYYFSGLPQEQLTKTSSFLGNFILFSIIILFIVIAAAKRINVYDAFIEGAKEGFPTAIKIIPYLIAILVAIGVFRASGAFDIFIEGLRWFFSSLGCNTDFIEGLPTAFMKPLSGSGARGMMIDAMHTHGADSFTGRLVSIIQGSTDTTFYIIAVYFGSVKIKNIRHAIPCGLVADFFGIIAAIAITYMFFH